jgi:hypothetical protein
MLSFLYHLARHYQKEHGYQPNAVFMNTGHYRLLQENLSGLTNPADLTRFLGMDVILSEDCVHPHVAWMPQARRRAAG